MKKILYLIILFLTLFTPVNASNTEITDIINRNVQESTDLFIQSTSEDIQIYVTEKVTETKNSLFEHLTEFIRIDNLSKLFQDILKNVLSSINYKS